MRQVRTIPIVLAVALLFAVAAPALAAETDLELRVLENRVTQATGPPVLQGSSGDQSSAEKTSDTTIYDPAGRLDDRGVR